MEMTPDQLEQCRKDFEERFPPRAFTTAKNAWDENAQQYQAYYMGTNDEWHPYENNGGGAAKCYNMMFECFKAAWKPPVVLTEDEVYRCAEAYFGATTDNLNELIERKQRGE